MSRDFDAGVTGRLTWVGLSVAAIGWALLVGATVTGEAVVPRLARAPGLHADLMAVAQCLIGSGFALAVIGSLQAGFGALNRFFGAVLSRSSARVVEPQPVDAGPGARGDAMRGDVMRGDVMRGDVMPGPARRPYRTLADGSVEVDTILGTRRFATMGAAREFI